MKKLILAGSAILLSGLLLSAASTPAGAESGWFIRWLWNDEMATAAIQIYVTKNLCQQVLSNIRERALELWDSESAAYRPYGLARCVHTTDQQLAAAPPSTPKPPKVATAPPQPDLKWKDVEPAGVIRYTPGRRPIATV